MDTKAYKVDQIIDKLQHAHLLLRQGQSIEQVCKQIGVTDETYHQWDHTYGGLKIGQAQRLSELEAENSRLASVVAELTVDNLILMEVAEESSRRNGRKHHNGE